MNDLGLYLDLLYGAEPAGAFVELRFRHRRGTGMGQEFYSVRHPRLSAIVQARGRKTDLYVGVAPRSRQGGTRAAVGRLHVVWADLDTPEAAERLEGFDPHPSMVVRSGSGLHCYWSLWTPASPDEAEGANRRLAHALEGDMRATDAARILRPPGTFNHKTGKPVPVTVESVNAGAIYTVDQVAGELPDPPTARRVPRPVAALQPVDGIASAEFSQSYATEPPAKDPLRAIPPPIYVEALLGLAVGRDGKVCCPFHEDGTPSLHVYDDPARGWACFGCGLGGTIIDMGAALYGIEPRGAGYHQIRERLEADLRTSAAA